MRVEGPRPVEGMGPTGALSNSAKTHVKSCTWEAEPLAVLWAGNGLFVGSSAEKFLEVVVGSKLSVSQQRAPATARANCILSCRKRRKSSVYSHSLDHYKTTLSSFGPLHTVKTLLKRSEYWSGHQHNWGLDSFPCEKNLRDQGLFTPEKKVTSGSPNTSTWKELRRQSHPLHNGVWWEDETQEA